jgi:REP element-mobilizing transposase RayT
MIQSGDPAVPRADARRRRRNAMPLSVIRFVSYSLVDLDSFENRARIKIVRRAPRQLALEFRTHGGSRPGAGRKAASARPPVHHVRRPRVPFGCPSHVTLRVRRDVPSLRNRRFIGEFRTSIRRACERGEFRVCHYSIQRDHLHLVVESAGKDALGRGMKSIAARVARAVNRVFGRKGPALFGRYHLHVLESPREVRHAVAYVLLNARKHWRQRTGSPPPVRLDVASSGAWFDGWKRSPPATEEDRSPPAVAQPRGWLLREGWRLHGLVDPAETPGASR